MTQTIHSHTFPNGLVLLAEEMQSLESAAFSLAVPAGCVYDPPDRRGLSGFTCEMVMRGAGPRGKRKLINDLDNLGVNRGESVGVAHTMYSGATLARHLPAALEVYADLIRRPHLPESELEPVRQTALQELRAIEDEPSQKLMTALRRAIYPEPWGRNSEGDEAGVRAITADDVAQYFQRIYRPNGTILSVAGKVDWPALKEQVGQLLGDWETSEVEPPAEGDRGPRREHIPQETNQTLIGAAWDSVPYRHQDYFQAWGAVGVLSRGMSSRLFTELRERRGLCYSVGASTDSLKDLGAVVCYVGTSTERAQESLDCLLAELVKLGDGIQEHELDRLKAQMKSSLIMEQESSTARSRAITQDWYHLGRVRTLDEISDLVDGLTAETISAYLAGHPPRDFTVVTLGPQALEVTVGIS